MAQDLAGWGEYMRTGLRARPYSLLFALLLIGLAIPSFLRPSQDWEAVYIPAAARLIQGGDIFQELFVYPPINAWLAIPFVDMHWLPARLAWYAINMVALSVLMFGAWKLSGGGRLEGLPSLPWREHAIFWLGLGCGISSCLDAITNQQTDLIVAALVIIGCLSLAQKRSLAAAVWFGVAAGIKCTPLLWVGYLAWHRRFGAALLVVVVAVGVNLLPDIVYPAESPRSSEWVSRFLLPMADRKHDFGNWNCGIGGNQSVPGLWQRWLVYEPVWQESGLRGVMSDARATPDTLKAAAWGSMLLLLVGAAACCWKTPAAPEQSGGSVPPALGLQFGLVLLGMVLLSPHSSKPHFCTLLLPGFCAARAALYWPNRRLLWLVGAAVVCAMMSNKDLVGEWFYSWAKWHGSLAGCALLLYAASCRALLGPAFRLRLARMPVAVTSCKAAA
jgi:Glycosyltransferase family 87